MEIFFLGDRPELVFSVADMLWQQWPNAWGDYGLTSAQGVADWLLANQMHKDKLPLMLVGVTDGKAMATAGLDKDDMNSGPYKDVGPWMVSVFVRPEYRGLSLGQRMVKEIMSVGKRIGMRTVYLWTEHAASLYSRFGWTKIAEVDYLGERVTIMNVDLGGVSSSSSSGSGGSGSGVSVSATSASSAAPVVVAAAVAAAVP